MASRRTGRKSEWGRATKRVGKARLRSQDRGGVCSSQSNALEEERSRPQVDAKKTDLSYEMVEGRYHGTTEGGVGQNTLLTCGNRTVENKANIPIVDFETRDLWSRARQPETSDIGEANPGRVCAMNRKMTANHEESGPSAHVSTERRKAAARDRESPARQRANGEVPTHQIRNRWQSGMSAHVSTKRRRVATRGHIPRSKNARRRMGDDM